MNENELTHAIAREHVNLASGLLSMMVPQSAGAGVGLKGLDGRYRIVSPMLETLAGVPAGAMTGKTDPELFAPDVAARLHQGDQDIATGAASVNAELEFTVNGEPAQCQCLKFPVAGPDGTLLMIGTVLLPIAGRDAVESMLQSLERLQQSNRELQKTLASIDRQARMDKLTGAWNRRRLEEAVANEMERLHRYDHPLSLLLISLDGFQHLNAEFGAKAGDRVLFETAIVLQANLRTTDSLARWADDQFAVLCPNTTQTTAMVLAGQLREKVASAIFTAANTLTLSIGVAECGPDEKPDQWFNRADAAMFKARINGRNRVQAATEIPGRAGVGETVAASFVQLSWHAAYECGNTVIDAQHRGLFKDANELLGAILDHRPHEEVATLIDNLINHVVQHFQDEEEIINAAGFSGAEEHAAIHRTLVEKAADVTNRFHAGTLAVGELFQFLAHDVVARHMLGADREFFPFLKAPA